MEQTQDYIIKCTGCGANMEFSPKKGCLECGHCQNSAAIDAVKGWQKFPIETFGERKNYGEAEGGFSCPNCGAKFTHEFKVISVSCPFCGTTNIKTADRISGLRPDTLVPFTIDKRDAESFFKAWLLKKWFVPTLLKKRVIAGEINGIYSSVYGYDSKTFSTYQGVLGKHYTRYVGSGKDRRAVTETRYFPVSGNLPKDFYDVLIECSAHFDQKVLNKLMPFKLEERYKYNKNFLSGFTADLYEKEVSDGWHEAKAYIDTQIKRSILAKYSYDVVQYLNISSSYSDIMYSYLLLPLYLSSYTFKGKIHRFYVNGNTGKTFGSVPRSPWKIARFTPILLALIGAALYFILPYFI